jgi:hypothetical protein
MRCTLRALAAEVQEADQYQHAQDFTCVQTDALLLAEPQIS